MDKTRSPLATGLLLSFALAASGCASTASPSAQDAPAGGQAVSRDEVTVENLLRWPLEGPEGVDKVEAALHQVFEMEPLRNQQFSGDGPVKLADGYVLRSSGIREASTAFSIGLMETPCFTPDRGVAVTGAVMEPPYPEVQGIVYGRSFKSTRNGMMVRFSTDPSTDQCVDHIHIRPAPEADR